jgi:hypothetical protein
MKFKVNENFQYKRLYGKISAYTYIYNPEKLNIPWIQSIKAACGFADEVVVVNAVDDDSDPSTQEKLEALAEEYLQIQVYENEWDWNEAGVDGQQKAFARALCEHEFLWQFDADEIVHENDYEKIKMITKRFPNNADILHLPVVELWGDEKHATGRRHGWKWRFSRNKPEISHGINKHARLVDEETGVVYAKKGMSDGCEYVNIMNNEMRPHTGFYNQNIEMERLHLPQNYARTMNAAFKALPSVWHTSWIDLQSKYEQLKHGGSWDRLWSLLYREEAQNRFPGVESEKDVDELIDRLYINGGEDGDQVKFKFELDLTPPKLLLEWLEERKG